MTDQNDPNTQKRREALNRLRAAHGTPTRPEGLAVDNEADRVEAGPADAQPGARLGGGLRARLAQQGGAAGAGLGGGLRARLAQQGGAGGAGLGGGLRARLAQQGGAGGAGLGGGLRARLAQQGGAAGAGLGGGPLARLRARGAQQADAGGDAPGLAGRDAAPAMAQRDPEQTRAFLRERIGQLQARLEALDKAAAGAVEDAVVFEEKPGPDRS
jgi:hypothetical protein